MDLRESLPIAPLDPPDPPDGKGRTTPGPSPQLAPLPNPAELLLESLEQDGAAERRRFRFILVVALVFHGVLLFVVFPTRSEAPKHVGRQAKVYVMEQVRFKKPPPKAAQPEQKIPEKKVKKIPIPDPTPDDPEPIEIELVDIPDIEPADVDVAIFGIPDAPPVAAGLGLVADFEGEALQVGDGVAKPKAIYRPRPPYTERARQKRTQGVVILSGIVDEEGNVRNLEVVKGLPFGLDTEALRTVATWKYEPSLLDGRPVAVHFLFQVSFSLQ